MSFSAILQDKVFQEYSFLGEVFGLVWEDIDFENKVINVNRQIQWKEDKKKSTKDKLTGNGKKEDGDGYWYFSNPKYNSFRPVEISDGLAALLKREKDKQGVCRQT